MNDGMLLGLLARAIALFMILSTGPLVVSMSVGLGVGVVQAATSVQEATLTFLPKLMTVLSLMAVAGPLMARILVAFTGSMYALIPQVAR